MYESLTGLGAAPAATGSPEAWAAYIAALRDSLVERRTSAIKAYNTLKSIRASFGLPFMGGATGESADLGVWPPDYEAQAVDILAMTKICVDGANDVLAGKRKLWWDEQIKDFAVEGFPTDVLLLQYGTQGQPLLIDQATGNETHVSGQVGIAPIIVVGVVALALVQGLGMYLIVDKALDTLGSAILQRTQRTLAEAAKKHAELVEQGKATPEQAAILNKGLYAGASDLERAAGESKAKETSDIADTVKTVAWVALGLGVLYVGAQLLGSMKFGGALAGAAARDNSHRKEADESAATELELYLENDRRFAMNSPEGQGLAISKNLWSKWKKGTYSSSRAPQAWSYVVESAAKAYAKEFDSPSNWSRIFNPATRDLVARSLAKSWENKARSGELDRHPPRAA